MALQQPALFAACAAALTLPAAALQDVHVLRGGPLAKMPQLTGSLAGSPVGPTSSAATQGSVPPVVLLSNLAGSSTAAVPGLPGVEFEPGTDTNHFDRIYGHPSGHWVMTALADLPSTRDECLIVNGTVVMQEGSPAPWTGGVENCGTIDTRCSINSVGDVAFATNTSGTVADDYVATRIAGVWGYGAREGDALPGGSGAILSGTIDSSVILDNGEVGYAADRLEGTALMDVDDDALVLNGQVLLRMGVTVPSNQLAGNGEFMESFDLGDFWTSGDGQQWLVQGDLEGSSSSDDVVLVNGAVVIQEGSHLPNTTFVDPVDSNGIKGVSMDAAGHWFARGDNDGTEQDWVVRDGELLAATGLPVTSQGTELWSDALLAGCFFAHVGNGRGDFVIAGMTDHPDPARDAVVYFNRELEVARESDPVDLDGNGLLDDDVFIDSFGDDDFFLNDDRELFCVVTLKDAAGMRVGQGLLRLSILPEVGEAYCDVTANSLGLEASMLAFGSEIALDNEVTLLATDMPPTVFAVFMVGRERNFVSPFGNSEGALCVQTSLAQFRGPGEVMPASASGSACLHLDLNAIPTPLGSTAASPGDTFTFQCWYRDQSATGSPTTNTTNAVEITFE